MTLEAVCVGDNCIDHYLPPIDRRFVGGNAVNVAVHLRRSGISTSYVGAVGHDEDGDMVLEWLRAEGVDVSRVRVLHGPTGITEVRVAECGDRIFVREDMGVQKDFALDDELVSFAREHDLVHNTILGGTVPYLARFKRERGLISFDYSDRYDSSLLDATLAHIDIAFFSPTHCNSGEVENLAAWVHGHGPRLVVITRGRAGSLVFDGEQFYTQSALQVDVVDTLGAGDAFIGRFLAGYVSGQPLSDCLGQATEEAAQTCTHLGAWLPRLHLA